MKNLKGILASSLLLVAGSAFGATQYEAVPGEYIVKLKSQNKLTAMAAAQLSTSLGSYVKSTIPARNVVVIKKPVFEMASSAMGSLQNNPLVEYVEPNYIYRMNKLPNDPDFSTLWGIKNTGLKDSEGQVGKAGLDIGAVKAWDIQTGSKKIVVAIIDSGVDYNHPDLKENMWVNEAELNGQAGVDDDGNGVIDDIHGYNSANDSGDPMDDNGHGSHCAGTIGAKGNNGVGVTGVNWDVSLMAIKFLEADGSGTLEGAIKAIDYATKMKVNVMSNSWGGGGRSQALYDSILAAEKAGIVFVAAAGNGDMFGRGIDNDKRPNYPSNYEAKNMIAVAAIDNKGEIAPFSNYGLKTVHVAAPGVNINSTTGGKYDDTYSGTSMATPHVSGVAALLLANEPSLTPEQVRARIVKSARPLKSMKGKSVSGGMVNAYGALKDEAFTAPTETEE